MIKTDTLEIFSKVKYILNGYILTLILVAVFFILLYPNIKTFPYSDDWSYVYYLANNIFDWKYILAQHNDHRIPLQKMIHLILLNFSGGDFRILVALNVICISLISIIWISIYRCFYKSSYLELSFPIILLSFGFNTVNWGFNFQFISSVFFLSLVILCWFNYLKYKNFSIIWSYLSLIFLSLCGGNGLIISTCIGSYFIFSLNFHRSIFKIIKFNFFDRLFLFIWLVLIIVLWFNFEGSSATQKSSDDIFIYFNFFIHIVSSYFGVFLSSYPKLVITLAVLILSINLISIIFIYLNTKMIYDRLKIEMLLIVLFATILLLLAITISRAAIQPWFSGLELHYGFLSIPILFIFIIIIRSVIKEVYLLSLLLLFLITYTHNFVWRMNNQLIESKKIVKCHNDILSNKDSFLVAKECIKEFYWMEGLEYEIKLGEGIRILRQMPYFKNQ